MTRKQQRFPVLETGSGFGRKLAGLCVVVALVTYVVSSPVAAAENAKHVIHSLTTFFSSL